MTIRCTWSGIRQVVKRTANTTHNTATYPHPIVFPSGGHVVLFVVVASGGGDGVGIFVLFGVVSLIVMVIDLVAGVLTWLLVFLTTFAATPHGENLK
jgi:hypothetical protein